MAMGLSNGLLLGWVFIWCGCLIMFAHADVTNIIATQQRLELWVGITLLFVFENVLIMQFIDWRGRGMTEKATTFVLGGRVMGAGIAYLLTVGLYDLSSLYL